MKNKENISIKRYESCFYEIWNEFVANAKNATFLFHRDFMEYHQDRFEDYSLLIFNEKNKLRSILPAHKSGDIIFSHQGLTYGGFVFDASIFLSECVEVVKSTLQFLNLNGLKTLNLKIIPAFYHLLPANEIDYILFVLNAKLYRRDSIALLDLEHPLPISRVRKRGVEKGVKNGLLIKETHDFKEFWDQILIPNLKQKYRVNPVHTLSEITYLKSKFPNEIRQFNVFFEDRIVAGITIFEKGRVVHPQYISGADSLNNSLGSIDFLYHYLLNEKYAHKKYFDFGISNENSGKNLNKSLHYFKESFGGRTINQDFYEVETANYVLLEHVLR
ncbi:MAG TPA: GNAT family N-acetyltransferase [Flavobacterium sp.]|nr:GNAT family N-acetyltransferase [Flavobacterium sp.]